MMAATYQDWVTGNQARLTEAVAGLKLMLRRQAEQGRRPVKAESDDPTTAGPVVLADRQNGFPPGSNSPVQIRENSPPWPPTLDRLGTAFALSPFERNLLLLCAAVELDSSVAPLCAAAQGGGDHNYPTFSLALAALPDSHWSALTPEAPLRRWRLIEVGPGPSLTLAPLRIDERVLHFFAGVSYLDDRIAAMVNTIAPATEGNLTPSQEKLARSIVAALAAPREHQIFPAVQICSPGSFDCRPLVAAIAAAVGLRAVALSAEFIPTSASELDGFVRLWEREAALSNSLLLVEGAVDHPSPAEDARSRPFDRLIERLTGPVIFNSREPHLIPHRATIKFHLGPPTPLEQRTAWKLSLAPLTAGTSDIADTLAAQFTLGIPAIRSIASEVLAGVATSPEPDAAAMAWHACRIQCRTRLEGLAQRIEPAAGWEDLVLPEPQIQTLRQIAVQVSHRTKVYETWGFAAKSSRGLGITTLFAGTSGTGKTMAAEVLAADLRLDLYRIDLASAVSKYIGETEKNLRRVFDAAEESGSILLFDEADALFGKRSEVKDSHDRYANIEVSYLLQRMEAYRGLAILTTNLKSALDPAFFRRLRFVLQFPFPDASQRAEIWRRIFPAATPTENLDFARLAKLNVPGGNIRNIALNAAFLAAADHNPVRMGHVLSAARSEYAKLERPLTDFEIEGWL